MLNISPIPRLNIDAAYPPAGPFMVNTVPPVGYPVTLDAAKAYLRLDNTDEDAVVEGMLAAASDYVQMQTSRALLPQQWELHLDRFPATFIDIPWPPCISVDEIAYRQAFAGDPSDWVVFDPVTYHVELPSGLAPLPARAFPIGPNAWWPTGAQSLIPSEDRVRIKFTAGYPMDASTPPMSLVPPALKNAILLALNDMYCNRGAGSVKQLYANPTVDNLIGSYRVWAF